MVTTLTHPRYDKQERDWQLISRMFSGEDVTKELIKRYHEHNDHYRQRKRDADFTPHARYLTSRLSGMLFQKEDDVDRTLSILTEEDLEEAGPDGEDYRIILQTLADTLWAFDEAYLIYNPRSGLHVVDPLSVPVWSGAEVVVKGTQTVVDIDAGIAEEMQVWTRYMPQGYEVYRQTQDDQGNVEEEIIAAGTWADSEEVYFTDAQGQAVPPVLHISMPWRARFGLALAKKNRAIFRAVSRRDFAWSTSANGMLQVGIGNKDGGDDQLADKLKEAAQTYKILPYRKDYGEHKGVAYPVEGIEIGTKIIAQKQKELDEVAYNTLEEATRKTATEASIQHSGGAAAALSIMGQTIEDAERRILRIMAQAKDYRLAGPEPQPIDVSVGWPQDFSKIASAQKLIDKVFPAGVPLDVETATDVVVEYLEQHGHSDLPEDSIAEAIARRFDADAQASSAASFL